MAGDFVASLTQRFGDKILRVIVDVMDPWIEVAPEAIVDVCRFLKTDPQSQFDMLNCVSGVDWEPHLEVVYHLSSTVLKHTLVLKVLLPRWKDGVAGQLPEVPSVSGVWRTANWHEREVYDLCGVHFSGHPDLRRILCPEDWVGHPLRKDYEMPLEYHGIRGR
jgi:NADH-quinone oxidoreductase subunit C